MSPFDVVLQEQQKHQITRKIMPKGVADNKAMANAAPITRNSNPMGQIQKL